MFGFDVGIALGADHGHIAKGFEFIGHAILLLKKIFAGITPALQVIGVVIVFDETQRMAGIFYEMPANHGNGRFAVPVAGDGLGFRHEVR
jgi:hypothetical protein